MAESLLEILKPYLPDSLLQEAGKWAREGMTVEDTTPRLVDRVVAFVDLSHFTALAEIMDGSALWEILNGFFRRIDRVIGRHEGAEINKFIGDEAMLLFADEASCLRSLCEIREEILACNPEEEACSLIARYAAAAHSGRVLLGPIGGETRKDWTVIGNAVNVASRIQESGKHPQRIRISGRVHERAAAADPALVEGFEKIGELTFKNKFWNVTVYEKRF